jgi:predicted Fe-Mo cluster-binding NifX family protein
LNTLKIAVTADMDNGLESPVSGHFGHCKAFIVSTVEDGEIVKVEVVPNLGHNSCGEPVNRLVDLGVSVLITMGMGMRPFMVAQQVGLAVVRSSETTVSDAIQKYLSGIGEPMGPEGLCSGGGRGHN